MGLSDNEIQRIPADIQNLGDLVDLDVSRNGKEKVTTYMYTYYLSVYFFAPWDDEKTELGIKRDLLRTNPSPLEVYLLVFKNI